MVKREENDGTKRKEEREIGRQKGRTITKGGKSYVESDEILCSVLRRGSRSNYLMAMFNLHRILPCCR